MNNFYIKENTVYYLELQHRILERVPSIENRIFIETSTLTFNRIFPSF